MHTHSLKRWRHDHVFGQDVKLVSERRLRAVVAVTATVMLVEVAAGLAFGSMALLADGLHMATHALALGLAAFAYWVTRARAGDARFSFGTGKVNALAGFSSALLLAVVAFAMVWECVARVLSPVAIGYAQAMAVAVLGLAVNLASVLILGHDHHHDHDHDHDHHPHDHDIDHNHRAAYFHVLADAVTSLLAIVALGFAWGFGADWLDPLVGIAGAGLIARWGFGLMRESAAILLDVQAPEPVLNAIAQAIESDGDARISDLHVWTIGVGRYAAQISVVAAAPLFPADYKARLEGMTGIVHLTVEVNRCPGPH